MCSNFAQFFSCIFVTYYIVQRYLAPEFERFSTTEITIESFLRSLFRCTVPGTVVLMFVFFAFLHSWFNAWAEMLRFGDRMFYKDWWNTTHFAGFYRTWNCVVHDWLYTYIYKEMIDTWKVRNKAVAALFVFAVSALFHEYIVMSSLKFFYPVLFIEFGFFGVILFFVRVNGRFSNIFLWTGLMFGMAIMLSLYSLELSARQLCPRSTNPTVIDMFMPRTFICLTWKSSTFHSHDEL